MFSGFLFDPVVSISNADFDGMRDVNGDFIRHDIGGDGADMWRAISNACHGIRGHGPLAYLEEEQSWERFYSECFQGILLPHFAFIFQSSCAGNIKGIISADDKLLGQLPALAAQRLSLSASAVFLARGEGRGMGLLRQLRNKRPECSFTTAFALHATLFSLPLLQAVMAYAYLEWSMGAGIAGCMPENSEQWQQIFSRDVIASTDSIRKALSEYLTGWQKGVGFVCQ